MMRADRRRSELSDLNEEETIELIPVGERGVPQQRRSTVVVDVASPTAGHAGLLIHGASPPPSGNAPLLLTQQQQQIQQPPGTTSKKSASHHHHPRQSKPGSNAPPFNPRLIFSQIVALQSFHYLTLGFCIQCNHVLFGPSITIDRIFTSNYIDIWTGVGWVDNGAVLLSSLVGAVLLALFVEKSKKCLDFSVTLLSIHFVVCCLYNGIPRTYSWYIIHIVATIIMTALGEYLCSVREMNEIPLLPYEG